MSALNQRPLGVQFSVLADGHGSIMVNGVDLSNVVEGFTLRSHVGERVTMTLELAPVEITGEAAAVISEIRESPKP